MWILSLARDRRLDVLEGVDFNYLLPLWYEDRLVGLLFLDTSPRLLLNEDESILAGLGGQISQAIESCILIERKIDLEKSLERSEHMASRGQMAAQDCARSQKSARFHQGPGAVDAGGPRAEG